MSAPRVLGSLPALILLGALAGPPAGAAPLPEEPAPGGTLLLPGRLPWGASALPTGEVLAPCEDQQVRVLDEGAREVAGWTAPARFVGPAAVAPRGAWLLAVVPLASGRFQTLAWDPRTRTLAPVWAADRPGSAPRAAAWSAAGTLLTAWADGTVEARSPRGEVLWTVSLGLEPAFLVADGPSGAWVVGPGRAVWVDDQGHPGPAQTFTGRPRGVLEDRSGALSLWTAEGLWRRPATGPAFELWLRAEGLLGVTLDRLDRLVVTEGRRLRRLAADGTVLSSIDLPRPAVTGASLDDRGRILVGTTGGLEAWAYDGRFLGTLGDSPPVAPLLITDRGLGVWGAEDWRVRVWTGFRLPVGAWAQDGGDPGRAFRGTRPAPAALRAAPWADDDDFGYFAQLVASGEEAKQKQVLDRFEAEARQGTLLARWPFANLILIRLARSGVADLSLQDLRVTNNWPVLRARAYVLLAATAGPDDRDDLIQLLAKEYDPAVAAQGAGALGRSGWDGDGQILRLLAGLQARMPGQAGVADAVIDAARTLWTANGRSADPVLIPLVTAIFQGPYPRTIKNKAQIFFQDLVEAP